MSVEELYDEIKSRRLYEFKAVDPKHVVRSQLRRHCIELDFPSANPVKYFRVIEGDRYTLGSASGIRSSSTVRSKFPAPEDRLPEEVIDDAYADHVFTLREALKDRILANHPAFFERLVLNLLITMGYGGSDPSLGIHTGGPDDAGIDGVIKEDALGLEKIYIQAKRWARDREVGRQEVQRFAGAMNRVKKGVFITTAKFGRRAKEFVEHHEKTISLIDGDDLCDLMIAHGVGVSETKVVRLLKVDGDYFSTES